MELNERNEGWQKEAPLLAAMEKKTPFTVPETYFEEMNVQLKSRLFINDLNTSSVFETPPAYFETLADSITNRIKLEKLKDSGELYSVPENYFSTLEGKILSRVKATEIKTARPVIKSLSSRWVNYAAAACITAIISVGIYFTIAKNDINQQLATVPDEEIIDYLELYSDAGDAPVILENVGGNLALPELDNQISEKEIQDYLETNL